MADGYPAEGGWQTGHQLAASLGALQPAASEPLDAGGAPAWARGAGRERVAAQRALDSPRRPQDRVALGHR
ncbi:MAG TPA: hypothetical protein VF245_04010 [Solirubrobacterales bacterium]